MLKVLIMSLQQSLKLPGSEPHKIGIGEAQIIPGTTPKVKPQLLIT